MRPPMCNLYSLTEGQAAIRDWFRAKRDRTGNLPLFSAIFPDQLAPIIRREPDGLVISGRNPMRRFPPSSDAVERL
jgi:putative SOS response-associated peptidase YedK